MQLQPGTYPFKHTSVERSDCAIAALKWLSPFSSSLKNHHTEPKYTPVNHRKTSVSLQILYCSEGNVILPALSFPSPSHQQGCRWAYYCTMKASTADPPEGTHKDNHQLKTYWCNNMPKTPCIIYCALDVGAKHSRPRVHIFWPICKNLPSAQPRKKHSQYNCRISIQSLPE
jgi:hypothetical protein